VPGGRGGCSHLGKLSGWFRGLLYGGRLSQEARKKSLSRKFIKERPTPASDMKRNTRYRDPAISNKNPATTETRQT
jgi:hypothetical protein